MKKTILFFSLVVFFQNVYTTASHGPLSIVPKEGTTFPTEIVTGYDVQAYYTITNLSNTTLKGLRVSNLPLNVQQLTTASLYADSVGAFFDLAPQESATLSLNVSGPTQNTAKNYLFVSLPNGTAGSGTAYPLTVTESQWLPISVSYEIIYIGGIALAPNTFVKAYKEGGSNPITEAEWDDYTPPTGYTKNTTRYLQFNESIYITSPGYPNGITEYIETEDGYTWGLISNVINAMWPYDSSQYSGISADGPYYAGNYTTDVPSGVVKVSANYKAQKMKFYACENGVPVGTPGAVPILRYYVIDQWGNKYIMHASDYSTPDEVTQSFEAAILPDGWTKLAEYLDEDFILYPAQGAANTYEYNLVRDDQGNTYHQMYWNPDLQGGATTVTSQIEEAGMPIWGGQSNDTLTAAQSFNNVLYGGGGTNQFYFPASLTDGVNTVIGFDPAAGDTLNFDDQPYFYWLTPVGVLIALDGGAQVLLQNIFTFSDDWVVSQP